MWGSYGMDSTRASKEQGTSSCINEIHVMLAALTMLLTIIAPQGNDLTIDWSDNRLRILSSRIPGGKIETWWLEAFCRSGSTNRKWEETTIPHHTVRIGGAGPAKEIKLVSTVEPNVKVTHRLKV